MDKISNRPPVTPSSGLSGVRSRINLSSPKNESQSGAVDDKTFLENFEKVSSIQIYSAKDVEECLKEYQNKLNNKNSDWEDRVECLKKIRSLILADSLKYDEFHDNLIQLQRAIQLAIEDLRSMIVREACITVAFMSKSLQNKFERFAESTLPSLINLIQKSQVVFSSSGFICIQFVIQYTHSPRLIPIITSHLTSKSRQIRKACCEFIYMILQTWPTTVIKRQLVNIQDAIKKGILDADADARSLSRKAFSEFSRLFPDQAESLKNSLDFSYRKLLLSNSNSGSNSSINRSLVENVKLTSPIASSNSVSVRSNSAIDLQAAKRARARAQYAAMTRARINGGGGGVASTKTKPPTPPVPSATSRTPDPRNGRTKSRVSVSQPTSRSASPSSKYSYSHYLTNTASPASRSRKSSIGGNDTSRETSPSCTTYSSPYRRVTTKPLERPSLMQKLLQQSRGAENQLADALGNIDISAAPSFKPPLKSLLRTSVEDHSDESETSSMCSETSFDSCHRPTDSVSWNGSHKRLYHEVEVVLKNINEIIVCCENPRWPERKKGLISLQAYILDGHKLEWKELKQLIDLFLRIFNDPNIKAFSLLLDVLIELIENYSADLLHSLNLLLMRLFNKFSTELLLNSLHSKLMKTLDSVYFHMPHSLQMQSLFRFIIDRTTTPNNRVKVAVLNYMVRLANSDNSASCLQCKDGETNDDVTLALNTIVSWTTDNSIKSSNELRRAAQEALRALFNLNPSQMTKRLSSMPSELQQIAVDICKNHNTPASSLSPKFKNHNYRTEVPNYFRNTSRLGNNDSLSMSTSVDSSIEVDTNSTDNRLVTNGAGGGGDRSHLLKSLTSGNSDSSCSPAESSSGADFDMTDSKNIDSSALLKSILNEFPQPPETVKEDTLRKILKLVDECPSNTIITNFKSLLSAVVLLMALDRPTVIKVLVLEILRKIVYRRTVVFLVKEYSDLVVTRVLSMCADSQHEVQTAAETCAIELLNLPVEHIVKTVTPIIGEPAQSSRIKLICIKMLNELLKREETDISIFLNNINEIMTVLIISYDDPESAVRKSAVFCMVALYKKSSDMKAALEPHIERLPSAKKKLLELYIDRAARSELNSRNSSIPSSPRNC